MGKGGSKKRMPCCNDEDMSLTIRKNADLELVLKKIYTILLKCSALLGWAVTRRIYIVFTTCAHILKYHYLTLLCHRSSRNNSRLVIQSKIPVRA